MKPLLAFPVFFRYALLHPKVKRAALAASFFLVLDLVLLAVFWGPAAFRYYRLEKGIEDFRQAEKTTQQAREEAQLYGQLVKRVKVLESKWDTAVTQSGLIKSLTKLSAKNGLKVVSQDFDVAAARGGGRSFKQNLALVGTYTSLRRFLEDLENLPTLTVVQQARLERVGEAGGQVRAILQLCTYTQSPVKGT
jgi:hypothetical protein